LIVLHLPVGCVVLLVLIAAAAGFAARLSLAIGVRGALVLLCTSMALAC
jgi:hypothetical protein